MLDLESKDLQNQKIDALEKIEEFKNIFPEAFEDGKLNLEKFKNILFDLPTEKTEHYSFNWSGKKECYSIIKEKSNATLKVDEDKTILDGDNVFIEGDNLEVLKLLQNSYHKKIKMIYIDPPYNKDKDFVYSDTWGDTITNYLIQTDQLRDEGYTSTKTSSTGRRHTNWLNMIYPRLWLSRNLLKDDGVIFVSIDDDEVHNLRKVMDEIYGEENFVGQITWHKKRGKDNSAKYLSITHEYLLIYAKNIDNLQFDRLKLDDNTKKAYTNPDKDIRGDYRLLGLWSRQQGGSKFSYIMEDGYEFSERLWLVNKESMKKLETEKKLVRKNDNLYRKMYIFENEGSIPETIWLDASNNANAKDELKLIFDGHVYFDTPKPVKYIKKMLNFSTSNNDIILDFFAGSGTTAHAVMELNQEDEKEGKVGNRKYILVQLPEATEPNSEAYKAGYKKISDITKERIKRVITKLDYKDGFKSYYLDNSNFQVFRELKKRPNDSVESIVKMLKMSVFNKNIFTQNAKEIDIVYEVGLKNGFSLSAKTEALHVKPYTFTKLYEDERVFYFCFADKIATDIAHAIPKDAKLICFDKALDDSTKLNLRENIDIETL